MQVIFLGADTFEQYLQVGSHAFLVVELASMLVLSITVVSMLTCQIKVKIANFAHETLVSILRQVGYHTVSISPFHNRNTACQI